MKKTQIKYLDAEEVATAFEKINEFLMKEKFIGTVAIAAMKLLIDQWERENGTIVEKIIIDPDNDKMN